VKSLRLIGAYSGIGSLIFCSYLLLFNPYTQSSVEPDVFTSFTVMYLIPIFVAIYASISLKPKLLIICSIWALPLSLYCLATPGLFKYMVIGPLLLFSVGVLILKNKRTS
jgi:hypothetical protein